MTFRIERKLNLNTLNVFSLSDIFHRQGFKKIYPDRIIFSCYLDTIDYQMYKDSIEGTVPRKKIRLRTYNKFLLGKVFLEIKINSVEGRYKKVKELKKYNKIFDNGYFDADYGICYPKLIVKYKRTYLKKESVRLTIDRGVKFSKFYKNMAHNFSSFKNYDCAELKCNNIEELNHINLDQVQIIRNSKYCNGINEIFREKNFYTERM
ncbi:VTC domain-containing protein [Candidatus Pelagibacter sp.]|nr:VTC domain-containing protein [Candidatus Pelagibacter sp.]